MLTRVEAEQTLAAARRAADALVEGDDRLARLQVERIVDRLHEAVTQDERDRAAWEDDERELRHFRSRDRADAAQANRGHRVGSFPCPSCGAFMGRPTNDCQACGWTARHHNSSARELREIDQAHGYR